MNHKPSCSGWSIWGYWSLKVHCLITVGHACKSYPGKKDRHKLGHSISEETGTLEVRARCITTLMFGKKISNSTHSDIQPNQTFGGKKGWSLGIILELIILAYFQPDSAELWEMVYKAQVFVNHRMALWSMAKWVFLPCLTVEEQGKNSMEESQTQPFPSTYFTHSMRLGNGCILGKPALLLLFLI